MKNTNSISISATALKTIFAANATPAETRDGHRTVYRLCIDLPSGLPSIRSSHESETGRPADEWRNEVEPIRIGWGVPEIDDETARALAQQINAYLAAGSKMTWQDLQDWLNDGGIPAPAQYANDDFLIDLACEIRDKVRDGATLDEALADYAKDWTERDDGITTICRASDLRALVESFFEHATITLDEIVEMGIDKALLTLGFELGSWDPDHLSEARRFWAEPGHRDLDDPQPTDDETDFDAHAEDHVFVFHVDGGGTIYIDQDDPVWRLEIRPAVEPSLLVCSDFEDWLLECVRAGRVN